MSVGRYFLIVASLMTLLAVSNTQSRMMRCLVNDDSERIRKEAGVASGGITPEYAWNDSKMSRKPSFMVAEGAAKIRTMHL